VNLQPFSLDFRPAPYLKPPKTFKMVQDPNVTVSLNTGQMWVASWVLSSPAAIQTSLLNHEQGHYDIAMMNALDVFTALIDINGGAFETAKAGSAALKDAQSMLSKGQAIQKKYDQDTGGSLNVAKQAAWDAALRTARITFVFPPLRTALKNAGLFP
jgi:hypothetical protein